MVWTPPTHCPAGHQLVPGVNIKRSWVACRCPKAVKPSKGPSGHDYVACTIDWLEWRENGCDRLVGGRPLPDDEHGGQPGKAHS